MKVSSQAVQLSQYCRDSTDLKACIPNPAYTLVGTSLVNQTLFRSAGCIVDHQHAERGSGNSGRYSASPVGMSAEPMALLWSHDIEVPVHKNVINNYLCVRARVRTVVTLDWFTVISCMHAIW